MDLLGATVTEVFSRYSPLQGRLEGTASIATELWRRVEQAELGTVGTSSGLGGAGGDQKDAAAVLRIASKFAPPVPLAETLLAAWLVASAGIHVPRGMLTVAPTQFGDLPRLTSSMTAFHTSTATRVPFAAEASAIVVLADIGGVPHVAVTRVPQSSITAYKNVADEPYGDVALGGIPVDDVAPSPVNLDEMLARGALYRAQQIAGALDRILEMTVKHSIDRYQFGRPIAKFQAVQHHVAELAGEAAAASVVAESAIEFAEQGDVVEAAAIAKSRAGKAAGAAALAHQVHGAIGATAEHPLHLFTRRISAWRDDFGSDIECAAILGRLAAARSATQLWANLALIGGGRHG
jgi:acyl-CoA dehydrogenase